MFGLNYKLMKLKILFAAKLLMLGLIKIAAQTQDSATFLSLKKSLQLAIEKNVEIQNSNLEIQK
jgi:hypothetical protein